MTTQPINIVDVIDNRINELKQSVCTKSLVDELERVKQILEKHLSTQSNVVQKYITNKEIQDIWDWSRYEA